MESQPLKDRVIAIPETREAEIFAAMLERRGAGDLQLFDRQLSERRPETPNQPLLAVGHRPAVVSLGP